VRKAVTAGTVVITNGTNCEDVERSDVSRVNGVTAMNSGEILEGEGCGWKVWMRVK
jgi:hypothetical protein